MFTYTLLYCAFSMRDTISRLLDQLKQCFWQVVSRACNEEAAPEESEVASEPELASESETTNRSAKRSRMSVGETGDEVSSSGPACCTAKERVVPKGPLPQVSSCLSPAAAAAYKPEIRLLVQGTQEVVADEGHPLKVHQ